MSDLPAIRMTLKGRTRQYRLTGIVNGDVYENAIVRTSHGTDYAFASLTEIPEYDGATPTGRTREVLTFHVKRENAERGNLDLRAAALGVRVITVSMPEKA